MSDETIIDGWPPESVDVQKQQTHDVALPARTNADLWAEARAANSPSVPAPVEDLATLAEVHDGGYIVETRDEGGALIDTDYSNVGPNVWVGVHQHEPWRLL